MLRTDVSALYIDRLGVYPKLVEDCWDEFRDARKYSGPNPIVAHPPCGPYSKQRHNYRGGEHDCALRAVEQVRAFGGVLEHPASSLLWHQVRSLPLPGAKPDAFGGFTISVCQCDWGHVARKPTWLYIVGLGVRAREDAKRRANWQRGTRAPTHWCSGSRTNKGGGSVPPGIKVCSAQQRRRTPEEFARWLIELAASARQQAMSA